MGKISSGLFGGVPPEPKDMTSSYYIDNHFDYAVHGCNAGFCVALGCARSWTWKPGPSTKSDILRVLYLWSAFRNKPSMLARSSQTAEYATLKKKEAVERAFDNIVRLLAPWQSLTIMCDWDEDQLAFTYDQVKGMLGGTVLTTKTLYFLVPDLFVILDRKQSYPPLRREVQLPIEIDNLDGQRYVAMLSYIRSEVDTLIKTGRIVKLKDGSIRKITSLDQFRDLSPRQREDGSTRPGTICKVVDDIFAREL